MFKLMNAPKGLAPLFVIALGVALLPPLTASTPAYADLCNHFSTTNHSATVQCANGGDGTNESMAMNDAYFATMAAPGFGPCFNSVGYPSYMTPLAAPSLGIVADGPRDYPAVGIIPARTYPHPCARLPGDTAAPALDATRITVKTIAPTSDFSGDFLTGARINLYANDGLKNGKNYIEQDFDSPDPATKALFKGYTLRAKPKPNTFNWTFGDFDDSGNPKVLKNDNGVTHHYYQSVAPDPAHPNDHSVRISVQGTWEIYLHQPGSDKNGTDAKNTFITELTPAPAFLDRNIVQVYSAQVAPDSETTQP